MNSLRFGAFYPSRLTENNRDPKGSWVPEPEPFTLEGG
jgi:hypothetical protein